MRMIPIECPKCGREGNVPPDRLNAKLTCRGCHAVFHLDNTGRMVMGPPGDPEKDRNKPHVHYDKPGEAFDPAEAWKNIPNAAKVAVPVVLLALVAWLFMPAGSPGYQSASEAIVRGLLSKDRSRVVSYATSATSDAAGKWFDAMQPLIEQQGVPGDAVLNPQILRGLPERDASIAMMVVLNGSSPSANPIMLNMTMARSGGSWRLDGERTLTDAQSTINSFKKK
jgi:hypothetical protein